MSWRLLFLSVMSLVFYAPFSSTDEKSAITHPTLKICWEDDAKPPFLMFDEQHTPYGIMVELVHQTLQMNNMTFTDSTKPWKRCLRAVENGTVDLVPNASYKKERAAHSIYTMPFYQTHLVLFYNELTYPERPIITQADQLKNKRVGGIDGFNYSFMKGKINIETQSTSRKILLNRLQAKRIDFALLQKEVVFHMASKGDIDLRFTNYTDNPFKSTKAYHVLVSRKSTDAKMIATQINEALDKMRQQKHIEKIYEKYLGPNK